MKHALWLTAALSMCIIAPAKDASARELSQYLWKKRPILIFANSPKNTKYREQMRMLNSNKSALDKRDIVVIEDTNAKPPSNLRAQFSPVPFQIFLIGKDGGVKLRSSKPVSIGQLSEIIDAMPMRQREMQN